MAKHFYVRNAKIQRESATMSDINQRIANLSPTKRALLELQQKRKTSDGVNRFAITKRAKQTSIPLSFAQQRLWYLYQLDPDSAVYNNNFALLLKGSLNNRALQQSLKQIVNRHESLRTTFKVTDGLPFQEIVPHLHLEFYLEDLRSLPPEQQEKKVEQLYRKIGQMPFDLQKGSLFRASLLCLQSFEHILFVSMHHIITDGWSKNVFLRELSHLYTDYCLGNPDTLPKLTVQYGDFSQWQRGFLQGEVLEQQLSYWKEKLADPPVLDLPSDRPRQTVQTYKGAQLPFILDEAITQGIISLCRNENATIFMVLFAAFNVLLFRYSTQEDILVGTPIANRTRMELEDLIGFFVNTLVLRTDLSGNPSFKELLHRIRLVALDAFNNQDLPFEKLVEELLLERDLSRHPLFQVMFVFQNTPAEKLELDDVTATHMDVKNELSKFDLSLEFSKQDEVLAGCFEYCSDLFDQKTIVRLSNHYQRLLEESIANPDQPISQLPLMSGTEREQIVVQWNATETVYSSHRCVHELFELQAESTPDAVALVYANQKLSYSELNKRANQLAHFLINQGTKPSDLVGICLERSLEMVVGIIATLKAGCAYVPLDPSDPKERLSFMIKDTQVSVILTQERFKNLFFDSETNAIPLDNELGSIVTESEANVNITVKPEYPAYVIYTSGSTGVPKGVVISHHALSNHMLWMQRAYPLDNSDAVLQKTSFTFDGSIWEFYAPLIVGARLIIAKPDGHYSTDYIIDVTIKQQITILQFVPSFLGMILDEPLLAQCKSLRRVMCGGEPLATQLVNTFYQQLPWASLHNLYGPAETTINVSSYNCFKNHQHTTIPVGKPIDNVQAYIVDKFLQPVPIGVQGELLVGGDGLSLGYLNRPHLNLEKFVPNPFSSTDGAKLYKSGDLARYLPDGNIEFLGRLDHQVKIRGFRIELGEIEANLSSHPKVRSCVITTRDDNTGNKQIIAYYVPNPDSQPSSSELLSFLSSKLPDYMVPVVYQGLESIPLTSSGKVNRNRLPEPDETSLVREEFVAPRTRSEELLAAMWTQFFNVEQISIYDNFFQLGGHSLIATQIVSRIRQNYNLEMPLRVLFERPTIAGQAEFIENEIIRKLT